MGPPRGQRAVFVFALMLCVDCRNYWKMQQKTYKALQEVKDNAGQNEQEQKIIESVSESLVSTYETIIKHIDLDGYTAYVGCYLELKTWDRARAPRGWLREPLTVQACMTVCWVGRFRLALLWGAYSCWCSNFIRGLTEVEDSRCNWRCPGNQKQACGGYGYFSIYFTSYIPEPAFTQIRPKDLMAAHLGCFGKRKCTAAAPAYRMTVPMCVDLCENSLYRYAGIGTRTKCCCSNNKREFVDLQFPPACKYTCPFANLKFPCGDEYNLLYSLYETGIGKIIVGRPIPIQVQLWMKPNINEQDIRNLTVKKGR